MRLYVYEPGPTAYISADVVMPDRMWREIQAAGLSGKGEFGYAACFEGGRTADA